MNYKELKENYNAKLMKEIQLEALRTLDGIEQAEKHLKDILENYIYEEAKQGHNNAIIPEYIIEEMFLKADNTVDFNLFDLVIKLLIEMGYEVEENNQVESMKYRELTVEITW